MARQTLNNTNIEGLLIENNLEALENDILGKFISGDLVIEVTIDEGKETEHIDSIPVNFFAKELKNDGGLNKIYKSLQVIRIKPDGSGLLSVAENGVGTKITISGGEIFVNDFYTDEMELITYPELKSNFIKKVTKNYKPKATFEYEGIVRNAFDEIKDDRETGRLIVEIVGINYAGNATPVKFVIEKPKAIQYIRTYYQPGRTVKVFGDIRYIAEKTSKTIESAFGEDITKEYDKVTKEFVVTSGTPPYDENAFSQEDAQEAVQNRNKMLAEKKAKKEAKMKGGAQKAAPKSDNATPNTNKKAGFPF